MTRNAASRVSRYAAHLPAATAVPAGAAVVAAVMAVTGLVITGRPAAGQDAAAGKVATTTRSTVPVYDTWQTFTTRDGLPSDKIYTVKVGDGRVWIGTDKGAAYLEDGDWHLLTVEDGLGHSIVLSIDVNEETGDVWFGTMSGLTRWSAGRVETFDQFNSGLANDVVYGVAANGEHVWAATAAGAAYLNAYTMEWGIFSDENAPMHEPWTYGVDISDGVAYIAAWGGGVLEYDLATGEWRDHRDPDGEMEIDLFPDDGLVHDITTAVSREEEILWVGTYFGLSRYDGARWRGYFDHDSGLSSNFINFVRARGPVAWVCTDDGLNATDGTTWVTYRRTENTGGGEVLISDGETEARRRHTSTIAHNYVLGVDFEEDRVWVATAKGLSLGVAYREATALLTSSGARNE